MKAPGILLVSRMFPILLFEKIHELYWIKGLERYKISV
jgi:hypothetical protein